MTEELAIGDFVLRQRSLGADGRVERHYDLVIAGLSWESRGLVALARLADPSAEITLLKFKSRTDAAEEAKDRQLHAMQAGPGQFVVKAMQPSTDAAGNFKLLKAWLQDVYIAKNRALSVLIDVTCIPKTYVLFILGLGFSEELFARLDCLYTPGRYDLLSSGSTGAATVAGPRSLVSEGEWCSRQIPYLEAVDYLADDVDLLVAMGGELGLSLQFIERFEPRRLGLIFIKETAPSATDMLPSERRAYEELLHEPNAEPRDIGLCDALGVVRHAVDFVEASSARGTSAMAIGSKPHALALGIAALAKGRMEVVCRTPAAYSSIDIEASGDVMLYEIEDRFDPASYMPTA